MAEANKAERKNHKRKVTREINQINRYVAEEDAQEVMNRLEKAKELFKEFEKSHEKYHDTLTEDEAIDESDEYFDKVNDSYIKSISKAKEWLIQSSAVKKETT